MCTRLDEPDAATAGLAKVPWPPKKTRSLGDQKGNARLCGIQAACGANTLSEPMPERSRQCRQSRRPRINESLKLRPPAEPL